MFYQNYLGMSNTADVIGGKPIVVLLQPISGVSAINPLVAFYDIHGVKREVLFFYFVPDTTRDHNNVHIDFPQWSEYQRIATPVRMNIYTCIGLGVKCIYKNYYVATDETKAFIMDNT
jgi:hypothetical protein